MLVLIFTARLAQQQDETNQTNMPFTSDIITKMANCFADKTIDVCTTKPQDADVASCSNEVMSESGHIAKTEMNDVLSRLYDLQHGTPIYHQELVNQILRRLSGSSDIFLVMNTEIGNILRDIFSQPTFSKENPFEALCYLKRVGSVVTQILTDETECYTLLKLLNENGPSLGAAEISSTLKQLAQSKRTLESHLAAYKDSVSKNQLGNLDFLISLAIKYRMGDDPMFKIVARHAINLIDDETRTDPIIEFLGKFGTFPVVEDETVVIDEPVVVDEPVIVVKPVSDDQSRVEGEIKPTGQAASVPTKAINKNAIIYTAVVCSIIVFLAVSIFLGRWIILQKRRRGQTGLVRSYAEKLFMEEGFE